MRKTKLTTKRFEEYFGDVIISIDKGFNEVTRTHVTRYTLSHDSIDREQVDTIAELTKRYSNVIFNKVGASHRHAPEITWSTFIILKESK